MPNKGRGPRDLQLSPKHFSRRIIISTSVAEAAALSGGCKVVGACHGDNPGTSWWTPEVEAKTWIWAEFSEAVEKELQTALK